MMIQGPEGEDIEHLSETESMAIFNRWRMAEVEPYEDEELAESLVSEELASCCDYKHTKYLSLMQWSGHWKTGPG